MSAFGRINGLDPFPERVVGGSVAPMKLRLFHHIEKTVRIRPILSARPIQSITLVLARLKTCVAKCTISILFFLTAG
jgi:hypothetical protein